MLSGSAAAAWPSLPLADWQPTRDTLHGYSQVIGAVRGALSPRQKHSAHRSLRVAAAGFTTTPIPAGSLTFELLLDLAGHRLVLSTNQGEQWQQRLRGQSLAAFTEDVLDGLGLIGVQPDIDRKNFTSTAATAYDAEAVERFWLALSQIDAALKRFRGELRGETTDVQLWPHGFDLAMLWFSGRLVPGADPNVPRDADEQMNFGFSTGDAGLPEPYFYVTAYPLPAALPGTPLPDGVVWHNQGWQGAVLRYAALAGATDAPERLLTYWRTLQQAGAQQMHG
jgi:hypothetical protein